MIAHTDLHESCQCCVWNVWCVCFTLHHCWAFALSFRMANHKGKHAMNPDLGVEVPGERTSSHCNLFQDFMVLLTAWGIGLGITIGIKMVVTKSCRKLQYRSYYRIKPAAARISSLALECWFIGLAGSVLIARIGQFLGAAVFWVGRIDSHFLSEEVSLFGKNDQSKYTI